MSRSRVKLMMAKKAAPQPKMPDAEPVLVLQATLLSLGEKVADGALIRACALPWIAIVEALERRPELLFEFAKNPRYFEEFIAATYDRAGFDEVILTPQRGDLGRDVIAIKHGFGALRFLDQVKAFSPGHLVSHNDVRAMMGTLAMDPGASKGLVTTTSGFEPGILKPNSEFASAIPHRLELKGGTDLLGWISDVKSATT